ncbi:hypothetical protein TWF694_003341 [Orbilia ellipsospora]|uniref:Uncharacterized protein n=1 Tax=Orbilia ellipsospora TaxID=2528407 RepID=A0AAV9X2H7_9PEZI
MMDLRDVAQSTIWAVPVLHQVRSAKLKPGMSQQATQSFAGVSFRPQPRASNQTTALVRQTQKNFIVPWQFAYNRLPPRASDNLTDKPIVAPTANLASISSTPLEAIATTYEPHMGPTAGIQRETQPRPAATLGACTSLHQRRCVDRSRVHVGDGDATNMKDTS